MSYSGRDRPIIVERLQQRLFDMVIVGGGINGASIAREAAIRGYSVALVEQADFAFGTSSRSSGLIHGGLRYLEHFEFGLVFESLAERARLARLARHLVRPLHFVVPVYRSDRRGIFMISIGLWLYDTLALFRNYQRHRRIARRDLHDRLPGLNLSGLRGAVGYYDYQTDDARLVLENILAARAAGAVALSYAEVTGLLHDRVKRLTVIDRLTGDAFELCGRTLLLATGPWTDRCRQWAQLGPARQTRSAWLRPTKGVHLVLRGARLPIEDALVMAHPEDGRVVFALPYFGRTVLGTTDTDFNGDPAKVQTTAGDVDYLLEVAAHYFPQARLGRDDVISCWAGVRPLLRGLDEENASDVSREHRIVTDSGGTIAVAGGKLTTYRRMAIECVDAAAPLILDAGGPQAEGSGLTQKLPLPGAIGLSSDADLQELGQRLSRELGDPEAAQQLAYPFGVRALHIVELVKANARLAHRLVADQPFIWGEVLYAVREEMALTLSDVLVRRTQLFYRDEHQGLGVADELCALMAKELHWSTGHAQRELSAYRDQVQESRAWRDSGGATAPAEQVSA